MQGLMLSQKAIVLRLALCVFVGFSICSAVHADEKRIALVIDQTNYQHADELSRVALADFEADLIESALKDTGFAVTRVSDRSKSQLVDALDEFRIELERAGPEAVGFVYYTGHGAQHPQSRSSFLLGTDARLRTASDLAAYGIDLEAQRDAFSVTGAKAVFLVFDACRNVATATDFKANIKGISRLDAEADMLVAYSTGIDDVAKEGVYAPVLAEELRRAGQSAESVFANVQRRVASATSREQLPWFDPKLYNSICFSGCELVAAAPQSSLAPAPQALASAPPPALNTVSTTSFQSGQEFRDGLKSGKGLGPKMVVLPMGVFTIGSPIGEEGRNDDEGPQHNVSIKYPLAVGKYEVTSAEYSICVADGDCQAPPTTDPSGDAHPVVGVSWNDAVDYVTWLTQQTGKRYRLLSEAEWEYAARAGSSTPFSFGSTVSSDRANYNARYTYGGGQVGEYSVGTTPVGAFPGNAFGLHDLHGNVWEWVSDCYTTAYSETIKSGAFANQPTCRERVVRGGSRTTAPHQIRSASRFKFTDSHRTSDLGFRIALSPDVDSTLLPSGNVRSTPDLLEIGVRTAFLNSGVSIERVANQIELVAPSATIFAVNSASLLEAFSTQIEALALLLLDDPTVELVVQVHASSDGADDYNLKLTKMRADALKDYLLAKGVAGDRVRAVGLGETSPVADNSYAEGRAANRRVEFVLTSSLQ